MSAKADKSNKDKAMASRMKREGVERTTGRCCMCHKVVSLDTYPSHLRSHAGRDSKGDK